MGGGGEGKATLKRKTERPKTEGAPRSPGLNSSRSSGVANCSQAWNGFLGRESTAWQGWHGPGLPPIGIAGLARARELGTAGLGGPGHAYLPRLAAELGEHVRGQQESRGAGWRLGRRVTQERLGEWLHAKCGGADRRRDETQLEKLWCPRSTRKFAGVVKPSPLLQSTYLTQRSNYTTESRSYSAHTTPHTNTQRGPTKFMSIGSLGRLTIHSDPGTRRTACSIEQLEEEERDNAYTTSGVPRRMPTT